MKKIRKDVLVVASVGIVLVIATIISVLHTNPPENSPETSISIAEITYDTNSSNIASQPTSNSINNITITQKTTDSTAASTENTDITPLIYIYSGEDYPKTYDPQIQEELYRQYMEFNGVLPEYTTVLSLWILESNLNPGAVGHSDDGTLNYGIPQLNTRTLKDCQLKGWYNPNTDNIYDYKLQINLGLKVLNELCETCPGGEWDDYRAIRAYAYGVAGLEAKEAAGEYGSEEDWYMDTNGNWYPGVYGKVKAIESNLNPIQENRAYN